MRKHDQTSLQEAYNVILQQQAHLIEEGKKKKDLTGDGKVDSEDWKAARNFAIKKAQKHKGKPDSKKKSALEEAYEKILESKHINKKFARRYNRVTSELLKCEPGSKAYLKLKNEREDLVGILKDHGMTPADLDKMLTKQEKEEIKAEVENKTENKVDEKTICTTCGGDDHKKENCHEIGGIH